MCVRVPFRRHCHPDFGRLADSGANVRKPVRYWKSPVRRRSSIRRSVAVEGTFISGVVDDVLIADNRFRTFDRNILDAEYVDGLVFRGNRIERSGTYVPIHADRPVLRLEHNLHETIEANIGIEDSMSHSNR